MSADKNFCMSSYLAFRYIEAEDKDFYEHTSHQNFKPTKDSKKVYVYSASDMDDALSKQFASIKGKKLGILLSGGMDSAILASYMRGCDAYTFRFLNGEYHQEELLRAEYYSRYYGLKLHYVDIDWNTVENYVDILIQKKGAPVHSIEPQLLQAALQAQADGIELIILGMGSDSQFGGLDGLLSQDWTVDAFMERYIFTKPQEVLVNPVSMNYLFERYRKAQNSIDFLTFIDDVFSIESLNSFHNAFQVANLPYLGGYSILKRAEPLDLQRIRNGESKYLIRELFTKKYPEIPIPEKIPMPRPVDIYFQNWAGPKRPEFKTGLDMSKFTGNQKWQMYCLERFLNLHEPVW